MKDEKNNKKDENLDEKKEENKPVQAVDKKSTTIKDLNLEKSSTKKSKRSRKKFDKRILIIVILTIIMIVLTVLYYNPNIFSNITSSSKTTTDSSSTSSSSTTTTTTEAQAETKTIMNTISSKGEISTTFEEKLELHTNYYFSEIYVETNQYVTAGTNILKYTNGTYLTAPCNCVITAISVPDSGSICTSKNEITIKGTDTLTTTVKVSEDELSKIYVGQEAQIEVTSLNKTYTGYVTNISSTATYSSSGSKFTVTIEFENDGSTLIGMTGKTAIILEKAENAVVVPTEAVTTANGGSTVTVEKDDGTTESVKVETGISNDAYIVIKSGIESGATVQITKTTSTNSKSSMNFGGMSGGPGGSASGDSSSGMQGGPGGSSSSGNMGEPPSGSSGGSQSGTSSGSGK